MDKYAYWYKPSTWFFRKRSTLRGKAHELFNNPQLNPPPEMCDLVDTTIVRHAVHIEHFDEQQVILVMSDLFISLCRMIGIEGSPECLHDMGVVEVNGVQSASKDAIAKLLHGVYFLGTQVEGFVEKFESRVIFSVLTVKHGHGGPGNYGMSREPSASQSEDSPSPARQNGSVPEEVHRRLEEEVKEAGSKIAALTQQVESLRQASQSVPRSDEVTALLVDKNATWIATDNALFAATFALYAHVLAYIPPLNVPMEYKAQLLNALAMIANIGSIAAFASQDRRQWATYVVAQLPTGQFLDARDFLAIREQAFIETALILMRIMYEKEVAAAPKDSPKPFAYHNLVRLGRIASGNTFTVQNFKDILQGKQVFTVIGGTSVSIRLNY